MNKKIILSLYNDPDFINACRVYAKDDWQDARHDVIKRICGKTENQLKQIRSLKYYAIMSVRNRQIDIQRHNAIGLVQAIKPNGNCQRFVSDSYDYSKSIYNSIIEGNIGVYKRDEYNAFTKEELITKLVSIIESDLNNDKRREFAKLTLDYIYYGNVKLAAQKAKIAYKRYLDIVSDYKEYLRYKLKQD